jgi:hypothetical protein
MKSKPAGTGLGPAVALAGAQAPKKSSAMPDAAGKPAACAARAVSAPVALLPIEAEARHSEQPFPPGAPGQRAAWAGPLRRQLKRQGA